MDVTRRQFLSNVACAGAACVVGTDVAKGESTSESHADDMGVLVDIPACIGCRKCEFACQEADGVDVPPISAFDDKSVFDTYRRPYPQCLTVVNRFSNPVDENHPIFSKINCLHCLEPACVSACLVGALRRQPGGAVTYDAEKCMGCRYCMVACPFEIPSYEYDKALAPRVRKCTLCFGRFDAQTDAPACVKICPEDALIYGKRSELLTLAHERIKGDPARYVDHVYGEHEVGGTSWLYLSSVPFEQLAFVSPGTHAPPQLTQAIQHGVFKHFVPPLALYGFLAILMRMGRATPADEPKAIPGTDDHAALPQLEAFPREALGTRASRRKPVPPVPMEEGVHT